MIVYNTFVQKFKTYNIFFNIFSCVFPHMARTNCGNEQKSLTQVQKRCDDKQSCTIEASNKIFGDPCPRTFKYLTFNYNCISTPNQYKSSVCEGNSMDIICQSGNKIKVINGFYGRLSRDM